MALEGNRDGVQVTVCGNKLIMALKSCFCTSLPKDMFRDIHRQFETSLSRDTYITKSSTTDQRLFLQRPSLPAHHNKKGLHPMQNLTLMRLSPTRLVQMRTSLGSSTTTLPFDGLLSVPQMSQGSSSFGTVILLFVPSEGLCRWWVLLVIWIIVQMSQLCKRFLNHTV